MIIPQSLLTALLGSGQFWPQIPGGRQKERTQEKVTKREPSVLALHTTDLLYFAVEITELLACSHMPLNGGNSL